MFFCTTVGNVSVVCINRQVNDMQTYADSLLNGAIVFAHYSVGGRLIKGLVVKGIHSSGAFLDQIAIVCMSFSAVEWKFRREIMSMDVS